MRALITWGGWPGHEPDLVADLFREMLEAEGATVTVTDTLDAFDDPEGAPRARPHRPGLDHVRAHPRAGHQRLRGGGARARASPAATAGCATPSAATRSGSS